LSIFDDHIAIGKVLKTIGLKGLVKVEPLTDFPDRFLRTKVVKVFNDLNGTLLQNPLTGDFQMTVERVESFGKFFKIKFKGFDSIDDAEKLKGCLLLIPESERVEIEDDSYYIYELIGLDVYETDTLIGQVTSIENYGAQDLLLVKSPSGKEYMIPYIDEFIVEVRLSDKKIMIKSIEGLLD
jgi:16S rRNA processing protein RimM